MAIQPQNDSEAVLVAAFGLMGELKRRGYNCEVIRNASGAFQHVAFGISGMHLGHVKLSAEDVEADTVELADQVVEFITEALQGVDEEDYAEVSKSLRELSGGSDERRPLTEQLAKAVLNANTIKQSRRLGKKKSASAARGKG